VICYLSPHPDDVALSCGGSVAADAAAGAEVTLITVFSEGPRAAQRREEDERAAALLGARLCPLELPDALDRPEVRGSLDLFAPLGQRHLGILSEVVARLQQKVPPGAAVRAPLGVGGHIDHRLVCAAARALAEVRPLSLSFYEDLPYSLARYALGRRLAALEAQLAGPAQPAPSLERATPAEEVRAYHEYLMRLPLGRTLGVPGLRWMMLRLASRAAVGADRPGHRPGAAPRLVPEVRDVTPFGEARLRATLAYASQWPLFFSSPEQARQVLWAHGRQAAGAAGGPADVLYERLWIERLDAHPPR
jgi:LmbE family N-acetylglucosaminyl deacetylase